MTSRRSIEDSRKYANCWKLREDPLEPEETYLNTNLLEESGPAPAPAGKISDMSREHRLVIAIDYGATFTGQLAS